jgi:hypothetical protein
MTHFGELKPSPMGKESDTLCNYPGYTSKVTTDVRKVECIACLRRRIVELELSGPREK